MDMSKRDELFENKRQLEKTLKEAFGRMLGVSSVAPISENAVATQRRGKNFSTTAFREEEGDEGIEDMDLGMGDDASPEANLGASPEANLGASPKANLDVAVDDNSDMVDDAAQDTDGASEIKIAADAVAQTYLSQLPSDLAIEADDQGIVFTEFHDDQHGPFKILLFPAGMSISEVAEVKEPANAESPLDAGGEELGDEELGDEELGDEELGDKELGDKELGDKELGDEELGDEELGDEEEPVLRESIRDRRLRKKGLIGNDRDPGTEEALKEEERDPMRAGRKSWKTMLESRRAK
jgi:hypothetical protein